jgi:hypothetical protein
MKIVSLVLLLTNFALATQPTVTSPPKLIVLDSSPTQKDLKVTVDAAQEKDALVPASKNEITVEKGKPDTQNLINWKKLDPSRQPPYVEDPDESKKTPPVGSDKFQCNQKLLHGFGLNGYAEATVATHKFCPNIQRNCCTGVDQELTMSFWKTKDQKNVERYYRAHKLMVSYLLGYAQEGDALSKKFKGTPGVCGEAATQFEELNTSRVLIEKILDSFNRSIKKLATLRTGFYCHLCDYNVQTFLQASTSDMSVGSFQMSAQSCQSLAQETIVASYYAVTYLKKLLESLGALIGCHAGDKETITFNVAPEEVKAVVKCYEAKDKFNIVACDSYCGALRLTKPVPMLDGFVDEFHKFFIRFKNNKMKVFQQPNLNVFLLSPDFEESAVGIDMTALQERKDFFRTVGVGEISLDEFKASANEVGGASMWESLHNREYFSYLAGSATIVRLLGLAVVLLAVWVA